ncbi:hypothetical protein A2837_00415 [Candidatus Kaiserbacteria bacterium RIFCSPHIGHO2_01_FULL_46_22]|uniref:DUF192 domain-containing protein n=1 Tax=Candidatus Kaiserbacteria bacterium RIFCSPHIGHO2_01_FULL_46_22 TaxID=1798475 RepID=A0A1F6BXC1_9BACT|nr:MAG: hypothetical protein A2837_00415 [Candidatus Kaiserbacteria bacterium RIFCSPHIGHO2_01_FULL_46_22]
MLNTFRPLVLDVIIFLTVVGTAFFLYQTYGPVVMNYLFGDQKVGMLVRDIGVTVSIADSPEERSQGLSGVESLAAHEGKLFIFDKEGEYGFWMKDMQIPLDIIWINNERRIVHIEENVSPKSYPAIYGSPEPARFVLEVNAFFASTFRINEGDTITIPSGYLPADLQAE